MKYFLMLFLIGTFVAAITAAPSRSAAAQDDSPLKRKLNAATAKAVIQALLKAKRQDVFEQGDYDDGLEQNEDEDDDGDVMAAIESLPEKVQAQFWGSILKSILG